MSRQGTIVILVRKLIYVSLRFIFNVGGCFIIENLAAQDTFLVSKMDKAHFVDLSVIAEFKLIKQLTTDLDIILSSIKDSDKVCTFCSDY